MHGAVAIVEMSIVASGRRLLVVGGGSFQEWLVNIFRKKSLSSRGPGRRDTCHLTDFFQTFTDD